MPVPDVSLAADHAPGAGEALEADHAPGTGEAAETDPGRASATRGNASRRIASRRTTGPIVELDELPGYSIRRLQQIAVAIFLQETAQQAITPVQYDALQAVANTPDMDQRRLARTIGIDTSTIGGVVDRLEARGLLERKPKPDDRRVRLLSITPEGRELLRDALPGMMRAPAAHAAPARATAARAVHADAADDRRGQQCIEPRAQRGLSL